MIFIPCTLFLTGYLQHTVLLDPLAILTVSEASQINLLPENLRNCSVPIHRRYVDFEKSDKCVFSRRDTMFFCPLLFGREADNKPREEKPFRLLTAVPFSEDSFTKLSPLTGAVQLFDKFCDTGYSINFFGWCKRTMCPIGGSNGVPQIILYQTTSDFK